MHRRLDVNWCRRRRVRLFFVMRRVVIVWPVCAVVAAVGVVGDGGSGGVGIVVTVRIAVAWRRGC